MFAQRFFAESLSSGIYFGYLESAGALSNHSVWPVVVTAACRAIPREHPPVPEFSKTPMALFVRWVEIANIPSKPLLL